MQGYDLRIIGPQEVIFEGKVQLGIFPGKKGELGILARHIPLVTSLEAGKIRIKKADGEIVFEIPGGFLDVRREKVVVVVCPAHSIS